MDFSKILQGKGTYSLGWAGVLIGAIMATSTYLDMPDIYTAKQILRGMLWDPGMLMIYGNAMFLLLRRGVDGQTEKLRAVAEDASDERARQLLARVLADLQQEKPKP